ncbi:MAG TPA: cation transporter [Anaerolineaceae bacterium]|nr:cation transporter [Anaerolineaceae bacterium]
MNRRDRNARQKKRNEYGQYYELALSLADGPRTLSEIEDYFSAYHRLFGMFAWQLRLSPEERSQRRANLVVAMAELQRRGWAMLDGERYSLTEAGREAANRILRDMNQARHILDRLQSPETASKVSLATYLILALIKLPAGLLSGSVGLINDSLDTLMDGLCSLLVYLGFRFQKERLVNIFQVVMLFGAGCLTLYQAVAGLFRPYQPDVDFFTFFAALLFAFACAGLYFYQRSVGLKSGSFGLITQSVDSRNLILVAIGVSVGLIASLLKFGLLDALVGLAVAALILKSAIELGIELFRTLNSEESPDLNQYRISMTMMERYRRDQMCDWMLYLIQQGKVADKDQLITLAEHALALNNHPVIQVLGLQENEPDEKPVHQALQQALDQGWIVVDPTIRLTTTGKRHLAKQATHSHRGRHRRRAMYV